MRVQFKRRWSPSTFSPLLRLCCQAAHFFTRRPQPTGCCPNGPWGSPPRACTPSVAAIYAHPCARTYCRQDSELALRRRSWHARFRPEKQCGGAVQSTTAIGGSVAVRLVFVLGSAVGAKKCRRRRSGGLRRDRLRLPVGDGLTGTRCATDMNAVTLALSCCHVMVFVAAVVVASSLPSAGACAAASRTLPDDSRANQFSSPSWSIRRLHTLKRSCFIAITFSDTF